MKFLKNLFQKSKDEEDEDLEDNEDFDFEDDGDDEDDRLSDQVNKDYEDDVDSDSPTDGDEQSGIDNELSGNDRDDPTPPSWVLANPTSEWAIVKKPMMMIST